MFPWKSYALGLTGTECKAMGGTTKADCAAFAASRGQGTLRVGSSNDPYGCFLFEQPGAGNDNHGKVFWRDNHFTGSGSDPACGGLRACVCKRPTTSEVCALTTEYWRMDSSATGLTGTRPLCPAGSVMSREQCGRIAEQHGKKWGSVYLGEGSVYLGEGYCVGGTGQARGYTVETCATRCLQTSGCTGFSFQHDSTGQCLLSTNGCASRRTNNWPGSYAITYEPVYLGEGYCVGGTGQASGYTVDTCGVRCRQTSGCTGFSFQHDSTGQCLLSTNACASRTTNNWPWKGYAITSVSLNDHLLISNHHHAPVGCFQVEYPGNAAHGLWPGATRTHTESSRTSARP